MIEAIARELKLSYSKKHKTATGKLDGFNIAVGRDKTSGYTTLTFNVTGGQINSYTLTSIRTSNSNIANIVQNSPEFIVYLNNTNDATNIASIARVISYQLHINAQSNCCGNCRVISPYQTPYIDDHSVKFLCNNCKEHSYGKPIFETNENHLKGFLATTFFTTLTSVGFAAIMMLLILTNYDSLTNSFTPLIFLYGIFMAAIAVYTYRRCSISKEHLKAITLTQPHRRKKYTQMISFTGISLIVFILVASCFLTTILTLTFIINLVYQTGFLSALSLVTSEIFDLYYLFGELSRMIFPLLIGNGVGLIFWLYMSHAQKSQSNLPH